MPVIGPPAARNAEACHGEHPVSVTRCLQHEPVRVTGRATKGWFVNKTELIEAVASDLGDRKVAGCVNSNWPHCDGLDSSERRNSGLLLG